MIPMLPTLKLDSCEVLSDHLAGSRASADQTSATVYLKVKDQFAKRRSRDLKEANGALQQARDHSVAGIYS